LRDSTLKEYVLPLIRVIPIVEKARGKTPVCRTSQFPLDLSQLTL
jgi:hypothetical protein